MPQTVEHLRSWPRSGCAAARRSSSPADLVERDLAEVALEEVRASWRAASF
ncbi:MAG: hypothetical protein IPM94_15200 [bacterium]|nr:hypothetical protein [bacterium]